MVYEQNVERNSLQWTLSSNGRKVVCVCAGNYLRVSLQFGSIKRVELRSKHDEGVTVFPTDLQLLWNSVALVCPDGRGKSEELMKGWWDRPRQKRIQAQLRDIIFVLAAEPHNK
jgi:hypothetical protein